MAARRVSLRALCVRQLKKRIGGSRGARRRRKNLSRLFPYDDVDGDDARGERVKTISHCGLGERERERERTHTQENAFKNLLPHTSLMGLSLLLFSLSLSLSFFTSTREYSFTRRCLRVFLLYQKERTPRTVCVLYV